MLLIMNRGEREHKTRDAEPFDVVVGCPSCDVIRYLISMIEFTWLRRGCTADHAHRGAQCYNLKYAISPLNQGIGF